MKRLIAAFVFLLFAGPLAAQTKGLWLTPDEIRALPTTGKAWEGVKAAADRTPEAPDLSDQDHPENLNTFARALVYVRTGDTRYRDKVLATLRAVPETENGGRTLALGRKLGLFVVAADLIGYRDPGFVAWLKAVRNETLDGSTLIKKHETKSNNWSQVIGFSRVIAAIYLDDTTDLARAVKVFKGTLGDRTAFVFPMDAFGSDLSWQSDPSKPMVVLPKGAMKNGHSLDGALPEELRRCCTFRWPPPCENYTWSATEGLVGTAWVLSRNGFPDVWEWSDRAILRVLTWNYKEANCPATGNDNHLPHVVNSIYGSTFSLSFPSTPGKLFGFGDWWSVRKAVIPPPDFSATWSFNWQESPSGWLVHKTSNGDDVIGFGTTPASALADWILKNPLEL